MRPIAVLLASLLGLCGCASSEPGTSPAGGSLASEACSQVERPPVQTGSHLIGDAEPPVPYSSTPASSGWHATEVPQVGVLDRPLTDPEIVSLLEMGVVVVTFRPDADVDEDVVGQLAAQFPDRLAIAPYAGDMPTPVALLTWGTIARCDGLDPAAVTEFVVERRVAPDGH